MATSHHKNKTAYAGVFLPILLILLVIVAGLFVVKAQFGSDSKEASSNSPTVGTLLPDFTLGGLNGGTTKISEVPGKVILLNFWATWCEACMSEMPSLVKLHREMHPKGLQIVAINLDENPAAMVPRVLKRYQMEFPVYQDSIGKVVELFDVHGIPLTVIMNSKREILYMKDGEQNWNAPEIRQRVAKWLSQ